MAGEPEIARHNIPDKATAVGFFEHFLHLADLGEDILKIEVFKEGHVYIGEATIGQPPSS